MNIKYLPLTKFIPLSDAYPGEWVRYINLQENSLEYVDFSERLVRYILKGEFIESTARKEELRDGKYVDSIIEKFKSWEIYKAREEYINVIKNLWERIEEINSIQEEFILNIVQGIKIKGVAYNKSEEVIDYVEKDSLLKDIFRRVMNEEFKDTDVLFVDVKSLEALVQALIICCIAKEQNQDIYISLIDSNFENFTFRNFSKDFNEEHRIFDYFHSVIKYKNQKDIIVRKLIRGIEDGKRIRGYLQLKEDYFHDNRVINDFNIPKQCVLSPDNMLNIELRNSKCHWDKCNFCTQSNKYSHIYKEEKLKERAKRIITHAVKSGFRYINFSDSAFDENDLETICEIFGKINMNVKWTCRCRADISYTKELVENVKKAGCNEILFGVESLSEKVLKKMNKYNKFPGIEHIRSNFDMLIEAGINIHTTLICGYPGESQEDVMSTLKQIFIMLRKSSNSVIWTNRLGVFNNTELSRNPYEFGIELESAQGDFDILSRFKYTEGEYTNLESLDKLYTKCHFLTYEFLGWKEAIRDKYVKCAMMNFFHTCHGFFLKDNIKVYTALNDRNLKKAGGGVNYE